MESPHAWERKIIDKKQSDIDWDDSQPKQGIYRGRIVFYSPKDLGVAASPWFFKWERYDPKNGNREAMKSLYKGWDFVRFDSDPDKERFVPQGIAPNPEGYFVRGDLVLMRLPMTERLRRLKKRYDDDKQLESDSRARFKTQVEKDGGEVHELTDEEFAKRTGIY